MYVKWLCGLLVVAFLVLHISTDKTLFVVIPYRLGDVVKGYGWKWLVRRMHLRDHPDTIACEYIRATEKDMDIATLASIVRRRCAAVDAPAVAVHVRLGDVVCHLNGAAQSMRPPDMATLRAKLPVRKPGDPRPVLFSGNHTGSCVTQTDDYITKAERELDLRVAPPAHADHHLCQMVNADEFVQGFGGYSLIISLLRQEMGKPVIHEENLTGNL